MTFFETAGQAAAFLLLLYAGFAGAVLYDLFGIIRRHAPRAVGIGLDVLWCLVMAGLCGLCLALSGESRARPYALLGLCCGAGIYCLGIRRILAAVCRFLARKKCSPTPPPTKEK